MNGIIILLFFSIKYFFIKVWYSNNKKKEIKESCLKFLNSNYADAYYK